MATLQDYYNIDFNRVPSIHKDWEMKDAAGNLLEKIVARIHLDFDANAKYWSFFIPNNLNYRKFIAAIFSTKETYSCCLSSDRLDPYISTGLYEYSEKIESTDLMFTNRVFIYIDKELDEEIRNEIAVDGHLKGLYVITRDREYAIKKSQLEKPLAFISHDWRDKDTLVRELAIELSKLMCPVWYDEYSLQIGDSLRESIEKGLKETKNCIVILSPNYLHNEGWCKAEFDSVFTREIIEGKNIILPIWHNVSTKEVYEYSPSLPNKFALHSSIGVKELARELSKKLKS